MGNFKKICINFLVIFMMITNIQVSDIKATGYTLNFGSQTGVSYTASGPTLEGTYTSDWNANYQYLLVNGEVVFCLDPSSLVLDGAGGYEESDFSQELMRQMNLIALHGYYEHGKSGEWYMASQFMMWELRGWTINTTSLSNYASMKNTIQDAINHHYDKPNFVNVPTSINVGESVTVTDTNNVLGRYTVTNVQGVSIVKNGNDLTIMPTSEAPNNIEISLRAYATDESAASIVYKTPNNTTQTVGKFSYQDPVYANLNIKVNKFGSLKIAKQDEDGTYVPNTSFALSRNADMSSPLGTYQTGVDGTVTVNELLPGTYYVQERAVPGHLVLDATIHSIVIKPNETASFNATNNWIKGKLKLRKTDTESGKQVGGATYAIYDANKQEVERLVTKSNGFVESGYLRIGEYTVKEVIAPDGYVLNPTIYPVSVTTNEEKIEIHGDDKRVKGSLRLSKEDSVTGKQPQGEATLTGAVYELKARTAILDPADGSVKFAENQVVSTLTTDSEANAMATDLYLGDYYVKEKTPSKGYVLDPTEYDVSLSYQNQDIEIVTKQQTVKERIIAQAFQIIKINSGGSGEANKLEGAEFRIKSKKDIDKAGSWNKAPYAKNAMGKESAVMITDKNGTAKSDELPFGTYVVRETKVPDDHYAVPDFTVVIDKDNREPQPWRVMNDEKFRAVVKIIKKDATTGNTIALAGAKFKIKNLDTQTYVGSWVWNPLPHYVDTWTSDHHGEVMSDDVLDPGNYQLEEIEAPHGYLLDETPIPFKISANEAYETLPDGTTPLITIEKEDVPVKGNIQIMKKGEVLQGVEKKDDGSLQFLYQERMLAGAVFELYAKETIEAPDQQGAILYEKDQKIETLQSDEFGIASTKELPLGAYYVKEIQAPYGFVLSEKIYDVTLIYKNQTTAIVTSDVHIRNERQKFDVKVHKYDDETKESLAGAVFTLYANRDVYDYDGNVIVKAKDKIETVISDEEGNVQFTSDLPHDVTLDKIQVEETKEEQQEELLEIGDRNSLFMIKEEKAPVGYHIAKPVFVYIDTRQTEAASLTIPYIFDIGNTKDEVPPILPPGSEPIPQTGDYTNAWVWIAGGFAAVCMMGILYRNRKKSKS